MSSDTTEKNCANCRHHTARMAPKPHKDAEGLIDGTYFVVEDSEQRVYSCRAPAGPSAPHTGTEIGPVPVTCPAWEAPVTTERDTRMQDMIAAWEARQRSRGDT